MDAWTPDLREVLRQSDAIVSVLPNTPETTGLLDGDVLAVCAGRRPVFINVSVARQRLLCARELIPCPPLDALAGRT